MEKFLPKAEQEVYRGFVLPVPDRGELFEVKKLSFTVKLEAKRARKTATDAVVPNLPTIRAKAQIRLNRLTRVRQAFYGAQKKL